MSERGGGTLIAIGGHEDRDGERVILREVVHAMGTGPLLILATASRTPHRYYMRYSNAFDDIGAHTVRNLAVRDRHDAHDPALVRAVEAAGGIFLTGGSQMRFVDAIRNTPLHDGLRALHDRGGVIAGTSAGASALGECMLAGSSELRLTGGLDLVPGIMFDQHFSQRDRVGRLTEAVEQMPHCTGLGIDEDTAIVMRGDDARVIGSGQVTLVDHGQPARTLPSGATFTLGDTIAA